MSERRAFTSTYVMQRHGHHWNELRPEQKDVYEQRAAIARGVKLAHIQEAIEEQETALAVAAASTEKATTCGAMLASNCRLQPVSLAKIQQLWDSKIYSDKVVRDSQKSALECPTPVVESTYADLVAKSGLSQKPVIEMCSLSKRIAHCRRELAHSVVGICRDGEWVWFRFAQAILQPIQVVWIPLTELEVSMVENPAVTVADWQHQQGADFQQSWTFVAGDFEVGDVLLDVPLTDIHLIKNTVFQGPGILTTTSSIEPMAAFLQANEAGRVPKAKAKAPSTSQQPPAKKRVLSQVPAWMGVTTGTGQAGASSASSSTGAPSRIAAGVDEDDADTLIQDAEELSLNPLWAELDEARSAQSTHQASVDDNFREHLLGGAWQVQRTGRVVYGLQSVMRPNTIVDVCSAICTRSAAFEYNTMVNLQLHCRNSGACAFIFWPSIGCTLDVPCSILCRVCHAFSRLLNLKLNLLHAKLGLLRDEMPFLDTFLRCEARARLAAAAPCLPA